MRLTALPIAASVDVASQEHLFMAMICQQRLLRIVDPLAAAICEFFLCALMCSVWLHGSRCFSKLYHVIQSLLLQGVVF